MRISITVVLKTGRCFHEVIHSNTMEKGIKEYKDFVFDMYQEEIESINAYNLSQYEDNKNDFESYRFP